MMNSHNNAAIAKLKEYNIRRVVVSREMSLKELSELKAADPDFELEYFVHGDMCICESGQCIHSGVLFANSSNRGRCMKACRWPYKIMDESTGQILPTKNDGDYVLALKDMCMFRNIPDLIQAGVYSFKIEGRMRSADFVANIVSIYRRAIDAYVADPAGYRINEDDWKIFLITACAITPPALLWTNRTIRLSATAANANRAFSAMPPKKPICSATGLKLKRRLKRMMTMQKTEAHRQGCHPCPRPSST